MASNYDLEPYSIAVLLALGAFGIYRFGFRMTTVLPAPADLYVSEKDAAVDVRVQDQTSQQASAIAGQSGLVKQLLEAVPSSIILPGQEGYREKLNTHWAHQECESSPACIATPQDVQELSTIMNLFKRQFDKRTELLKANGSEVTTFSVRGGGHMPVSRASSINGGLLIDMSKLNQVVVAEDRQSVTIGAGAKWNQVTKVLDAEGLAVVGGRSSMVGVGGLILGGGVSYFSPRYGFVCSNVISYEVVLASGQVITASSTDHPRLWRALKGGLNNYGIVTKFQLKAFPSTPFWSGWLYLPALQQTKAMNAFHEFIGRRGHSYDSYAGGPILVFSFLQPFSIKAITLNLAYTKPPINPKAWPDCFKNSGFSRLWRLWSTCKTQTLTSMTDEMDAATPPGKRQLFCTTTIKYDLQAMYAVHRLVTAVNADLKTTGLGSYYWGQIFQPLLPSMIQKGDANNFGLDDVRDEPLIIVSMTVAWKDAAHDATMQNAAKRIIGQIEEYSKANGVYHRYKNTNYCGQWQSPFETWGEENLAFMRDVASEVDPDRVFQDGCPGGFKIWPREEGP